METKQKFFERLYSRLTAAVDTGHLLVERPLKSKQGAEIVLADGTRLLNFCSNNYLGLGANPEVIEAAKASLDECGYGLAAGRLLCGTHEKHHILEKKLSEFL